MIMKRTLGAGALTALLIATLAASPASAIETGQMLDKGKPKCCKTAKKGQKNDKIKDNGERTATEQPVEATEPSTMRQKSDTIKPDPPLAAARNKSDVIRPNPDTIARNKSEWIIPVVSALAVGVGVLVVASGDSKPASPN